MRKVTKLTENDLNRIVKRIISETESMDEKYAKYQVAEQRDYRVKDDEYIKSHIHYGKDEFGNCWAWGSHTGLVLMECSKIGR